MVGGGDGYTLESVRCYLEKSLQKKRLPQTYGLFLDGKIIGMFEFTLGDLKARPDIYPWLANVYIDEQHRGKGFGRELLKNVEREAKKNLPFDEMFLYTSHNGLYEKFGWKFVSEIDTYHEDPRIQKLYQLNLKSGVTKKQREVEKEGGKSFFFLLTLVLTCPLLCVNIQSEKRGRKKLENENSIRKAAREAVEYWAEQIDFEVLKNNKNIDGKVKVAEEFFAKRNPIVLAALKAEYPDLKEYFLEELRRHSPTQSQLDMFKQTLFKEIVKEVSERKCCYLYTDKDGAGMKLAIIARQCGVIHDENSWFKKGVEMFVTPGRVELRFDPNAKGLVTYYDEKQASVGRSKKQ